MTVRRRGHEATVGCQPHTHLLTFYTIISGCERGERQAWQAFLENYTPVARRLLHLFTSSDDRETELWRRALARLSAEQFRQLRTLEHRSEREFLFDLRWVLLEEARLEPGEDDPDSAPPPSTLESLSALVAGHPLVHQEAILLKLAGYSNSTLERLLLIRPSVSERALEPLRANYSQLLARKDDRCAWPATWIQLVYAARAAKTEACPGVRQFIRIQEGELGWYEKEPAEKHLIECRHCLADWTALRETKFWRVEAPAAPAEEIDALFSFLPVSRQDRRRKSLWARWLSG